MKKKVFSVVCAAVLLMSAALFVNARVLTADDAAAAETTTNAGVIEVTGNGVVKVKPDVAILNIGVTTNGETTEVQTQNTKDMNKVLAAVKALGVSEKDIRTTSYYLNPNYDYNTYEKGTYKIVGYTVSNMIEVKVRNIDKAGEVLSSAVSAGANVNNGVSFTVSDTEAYYNEALTKAFENAKGKGETLAKAMGVKIGLPCRVTESSNYYTPYLYGNYNTMSAAADTGAMKEAVSVEQGEIEISATVTVGYEY